MHPPFFLFFKHTKWGIGISGFTWWFAASVPPIPERHRWITLFFLPWLLWSLPYHRFLRSSLWPALIAVSLWFRDEYQGIALVTQLFLALAYYFFVLEEEPIPEENAEPLQERPLSLPRGPELFLVISSLTVALGLVFFPDHPALAVLFVTALAGANLIWWKRACSFRISRLTRYAGVGTILGLCALIYVGHRVNFSPLLIGSVTATLAFTLLSPLAIKESME